MVQLYNDDCMAALTTLQTGSVDFVLTDLPYGMTSNQWDNIIPFEPMWKELKRICKPNAAIVLHSMQPFTTKLIASNYKMFKYCWVWEKNCPTGHLLAKKMPMRSHEDICVFYARQCLYKPQMRAGFKPYTKHSKGTGSSNYNGGNKPHITVSDGSRYPLSYLRFVRDKERKHPTQKPVALAEYLIETYTNKGDVVLDFTMGSGTTGVAAKNLGRRFIGCERDSAYFKLAQDRIGV